MSDAIEGTVVGESGGDLVHSPPQASQPPSTLFRTSDPVEVIEHAAKVADALKSVLARQGLTTNIQGKEHVRVEGWTTLGSMLGVVPVVAWTHKLENGWEARVEARTLDGRVVGAAEAQCTRDERMWSGRDEYALRSMAQTRATSKALRGPLGFIVTLAGYDATPAEEMPAQSDRVAGAAPPAQRPQSSGGDQATESQLKFLANLRKRHGLGDETPEGRAAWSRLLEQEGVDPSRPLPKFKASRLIERLKSGPTHSQEHSTDVPAPDGFDTP